MKLRTAWFSIQLRENPHDAVMLAIWVSKRSWKAGVQCGHEGVPPAVVGVSIMWFRDCDICRTRFDGAGQDPSPNAGLPARDEDEVGGNNSGDWDPEDGLLESMAGTSNSPTSGEGNCDDCWKYTGDSKPRLMLGNCGEFKLITSWWANRGALIHRFLIHTACACARTSGGWLSQELRWGTMVSGLPCIHGQLRSLMRLSNRDHTEKDDQQNLRE